MKATTFIQGRKTSEEEIEFVQRFIKENADLHRKALSIKLAKLWNWQDANGRLKDMACRSFMLKQTGTHRIASRSAPSNNSKKEFC